MKSIQSLLPGLNSILKVRDDLGAALHQVSIITRTWSGNECGAGDFTDAETQVTPTPRIFKFGPDVRLREGGVVEMGDIKLTNISKATFPNQNQVDCSPTEKNIESFYKVGSEFFRVKGVYEHHLTWELHLRKIQGE